MNKENTEIHEILSLLEECGLCPQLCDANVPYFDAGIRAGVPADNGDSICEEYLRLPKEMMENDALVVARVKGDSMKAYIRATAYWCASQPTCTTATLWWHQ